MSIKSYFSLVKFSHTLFALPFSLIGFFHGLSITQTPFSPYKLLFMIVCMVTARNAAMAFNRYLDRDIDIKNERTKSREIPGGVLKPRAVLWFVVLNCVLFVAAASMINLICLILSPVALFVVLFYSYTKRFTPLCHFVLGLGLALAPVGAYLSVTGEFSILIFALATSVLLWVSGFDIIYALQDYEFDKSNKLNSIPVFLGLQNARKLSFVLHIFCLILLCLYFYEIEIQFVQYGVISIIGLALFTGLVLYQHTLVNINSLEKINADFFLTNGLGSLFLGASFLLDYFI